MAVDAVTVDNLLFEHVAIRQYIRLLGTRINEQEAMFLQKTGAWSLEQAGKLNHRQLNLREALESNRAGALKESA